MIPRQRSGAATPTPRGTTWLSKEDKQLAGRTFLPSTLTGPRSSRYQLDGGLKRVEIRVLARVTQNRTVWVWSLGSLLVPKASAGRVPDWKPLVLAEPASCLLHAGLWEQAS